VYPCVFLKGTASVLVNMAGKDNVEVAKLAEGRFFGEQVSIDRLEVNKVY
jgi:hypothetical protein